MTTIGSRFVDEVTGAEWLAVKAPAMCDGCCFHDLVIGKSCAKRSIAQGVVPACDALDPIFQPANDSARAMLVKFKLR